MPILMVSEVVGRVEGAWDDHFSHPGVGQSVIGAVGSGPAGTATGLRQPVPSRNVNRGRRRQRTFVAWTYLSPILLSFNLRRMGERYVHVGKVRSRSGALRADAPTPRVLRRPRLLRLPSPAAPRSRSAALRLDDRVEQLSARPPPISTPPSPQNRGITTIPTRTHDRRAPEERAGTAFLPPRNATRPGISHLGPGTAR